MGIVRTQVEHTTECGKAQAYQPMVLMQRRREDGRQGEGETGEGAMGRQGDGETG